MYVCSYMYMYICSDEICMLWKILFSLIKGHFYSFMCIRKMEDNILWVHKNQKIIKNFPSLIYDMVCMISPLCHTGIAELNFMWIALEKWRIRFCGFIKTRKLPKTSPHIHPYVHMISPLCHIGIADKMLSFNNAENLQHKFITK